jgi:tetratricopeptide (TPR) repeat protein
VDEALKIYPEILRVSKDPEDFKNFLQYFQEHKSRGDLEKFFLEHGQGLPETFHNSLLLILAEMHMEKEEWSKAVAMYKKAIQAGMESPNIFYNFSIAYEQTGDLVRAIEMLKRYLRKDSEDVQGLTRLGVLQERNGALKEARRTYETLLKKNPENEEVLIRQVALLEKMGEKESLIEMYERLSKLRPHDKIVQFNLGTLYYEAKNWEKATEIFEAVANLDSKDIDSRKYLLDLYERKGDQSTQEKMLKALIELSPGSMDYYKALFSLYDKASNYRAIVSFFGKVTKQRYPNSTSLHKYVLYGALKLGDKTMALEELEHLIRINPQEKKYLQQAAQLYEDQKNYELALKKIEQVLKLAPDDDEAKDDYLRVKQILLRE